MPSLRGVSDRRDRTREHFMAAAKQDATRACSRGPRLWLTKLSRGRKRQSRTRSHAQTGARERRRRFSAATAAHACAAAVKQAPAMAMCGQVTKTACIVASNATANAKSMYCCDGGSGGGGGGSAEDLAPGLRRCDFGTCCRLRPATAQHEDWPPGLHCSGGKIGAACGCCGGARRCGSAPAGASSAATATAGCASRRMWRARVLCSAAKWLSSLRRLS